MSKKLLLNNHSVNGLLPVQDGLICWLDAFDLNSYSAGDTWNDRSSYGNNGIVRTLSTLVSIDNGILYANSIVDIPNPTKNLSSYTVEIGYEDIEKTYWHGLWGNRSGSSGRSFYQTHASYNAYPGLNTTISSKNEIMGGKNFVVFTFSSSFLNIYHNGKLYLNCSLSTTNNQIPPSTANYLCFMSRKPNSNNDDTQGGTDCRLAKWYYIRIYNKTLTEEEILNNYNYELSLQRG